MRKTEKTEAESVAVLGRVIDAESKALEARIQAEIVKYLRGRKIFCYSTPNEQATHSPAYTSKLVAMGLFSGVADLTVWLGRGRVLYLEVKTPTGKQSERQKHFEEKCKANGYPYYVVRSVGDVEKVLEDIGADKA